MATAVHGTVLVVDVASFGDLRRTNDHQLTVRQSLYRMLATALPDWESCHREDRGDGVLVVLPPTAAKRPLAESLPAALIRLLAEHNSRHAAEEQIRLRMALHAGEIHHDEHGVAGRAVTLAFRLVDAPVFKQALGDSSFALITSAWFYEEVVWHAAIQGFRQVTVEAKETSTAAWIWVPDAQGRAPATDRPHQLPTNTRQFAGRDAELDRLARLPDEAAETVIITAIDGSAGIGKTTLALHWAHQVKDRFPDGQLHVNLRGFDPGEPMDAGQALHEFLQALGVAPKSIPAELDAKAAMYRTRLAGRQILIMLDNARSADHVRPLLPGTPSCLVLITSRNRLDSLAVHEGAVRIALDVMSSAEANALLEKRIGAARMAAEPEAVTEVVDLCASLPLALGIVAARAADYPDVSLRVLADELRHQRRRLDALDRGELDLSVRSVFSWSYEVLSPGAARLFRLLGVHPGPDIDGPAADALIGEPAKPLLNDLTRAHMLAEYVPGRYRFHDLLRAYAAELGREDPECTRAAERFLGYYLALAQRADAVIQPWKDGIIRKPAGNLPYSQAMAWFGNENEVLLAAIAFAAQNGFPGHAWQLAGPFNTYLRRVGRYRERVVMHQLTAQAARQAGDTLGLATSLRRLGRAYLRLDKPSESLDCLDEALELFRRIGDRLGEFGAQVDRAWSLRAAARFSETMALVAELDEVAEALGAELVKTDLLYQRCTHLLFLGHSHEARSGFERVLSLYAQCGHREGEAAALRYLAESELSLGRYPQALAYCRRALAVNQELGDRFYEAVILERIGDVHIAVRQPGQAREWLSRSLVIFEDVHSPAAARVRQKLHGI